MSTLGGWFRNGSSWKQVAPGGCRTLGLWLEAVVGKMSHPGFMVRNR